MKKIFVVFAAMLLLVGAVMPASATASDDAPVISIGSADVQVGETFTVTLSMANVTDFTSGDINLQFNPNILRLTQVAKSSAMEADREISMMYTDPQNEEDYQKVESYTFNLALFHLYQFPQSLDTCDVVSLTFEAIGVGECPLVLLPFLAAEKTPSQLKAGITPPMWMQIICIPTRPIPLPFPQRQRKTTMLQPMQIPPAPLLPVRTPPPLMRRA